MKNGLCSYKDLSNGSLTMADVWIMNDFLDLSDYMEASLNEKAKRESGL
jgi:hypothetical protein